MIKKLPKKRKIKLIKQIREEKRILRDMEYNKNSRYVKTIPDLELPISDSVKLVFNVAQRSEDSEPHIDIRTWVDIEDKKIPTKRGINFNVEHLDEFKNKIAEIKRELDNMFPDKEGH